MLHRSSFKNLGIPARGELRNRQDPVRRAAHKKSENLRFVTRLRVQGNVPIRPPPHHNTKKLSDRRVATARRLQILLVSLLWDFKIKVGWYNQCFCSLVICLAGCLLCWNCDGWLDQICIGSCCGALWGDPFGSNFLQQLLNYHCFSNFDSSATLFCFFELLQSTYSLTSTQTCFCD